MKTIPLSMIVLYQIFLQLSCPMIKTIEAIPQYRLNMNGYGWVSRFCVNRRR